MVRTTLIERNMMLGRCIEACRDCRDVCAETLAYCLEKGGPLTEVRHTVALQDCAQACELSEGTMVRESNFMNRVCSLCADVCEACAESCDNFDDEVLEGCANRCRSCADNCREMLTGGEIHNRLTSFS